MVRKYNYYAKRGKTIVGASDGEIGNANGRSYDRERRGLWTSYNSCKRSN